MPSAIPRSFFAAPVGISICTEAKGRKKSIGEEDRGKQEERFAEQEPWLKYPLAEVLYRFDTFDLSELFDAPDGSVVQEEG